MAALNGGHEQERRDLRVAAPDALRGFVLVHRLAGSELTGSDGDGYAVVGTINGNIARVLTTVREWLRDEQIEETVVHVGDRAYTMGR
jgi:hypothetical protein